MITCITASQGTVPKRNSQEDCVETHRDFVCPWQCLPLPHHDGPNYWIPVASVINCSPSNSKEMTNVGFSGLIKIFWWMTPHQVTMNSTTAVSDIHQSLVHSLGFLRGNPHLQCWRGQFTDISKYWIFLFKTCFDMSTFLKGDLSWSPEPIQMKLDKVL